MEDKWLNVDDIYEYLSITNDTVYNWIKPSSDDEK